MNDNITEEVKTYYFTFTQRSELKNHYVAIKDTYVNARNRMVNIFGSAWAFQYDSKEAAGVDRFNLACLITL